MMFIDFASGGTTLFVNFETFCYPFPLTAATLLELATLCLPIKCKLFNVPISAIPTYDSIRRLSPHQLNCINGSVSTVLSYINTYSGGHYRNVFLPIGSSLNIISRTNYFEGYSPEVTYELPESMVVSSIDSCFANHELSVHGVNAVWHTLFEICRPSVCNLKLQWSSHDIVYDLSLNVEIQQIFPNLRKLNLRIHSSINLDKALRNLDNLEDLRLRWLSLDDESFLGSDNDPTLLKLKKLAHIRIKACRISISDLVFQRVFQHMKLKTFVYDSYSPQVTFINGISALAGRDSVFKNSIEKFKCYIPEEVGTEDVIPKFKLGFKNLKNKHD